MRIKIRTFEIHHQRRSPLTRRVAHLWPPGCRLSSNFHSQVVHAIELRVESKQPLIHSTLSFFHLNDFLASTKIAPHDPSSQLTPPYLHVVNGACAPHELERVGSIVTCCMNHSNRFLFDTYAVSHSCLQERFPLQMRTAHPPSSPPVDWE